MISSAKPMPPDLEKGKKKIQLRSVFISDLHIGIRGCQAEDVIGFLKSVDCDYLYLMGDIFDLWNIGSRPYWRKEFNKIVEIVLKKARKGVQVIYIPGNHDEKVRQFCGISIGNIHVQRDAVHETADGQRYYVCHGDDFDVVSQYARWLACLGHSSYEILLGVNRVFNWVRRRCGFKYWSLSAFVKFKVKRAVNFIGAYEEALIGQARRKGFDGVICGHIHHPELRHRQGLIYCNTGDWVESLSAIVEHPCGRLELVRWTHSDTVEIDLDRIPEDERPMQPILSRATMKEPVSCSIAESATGPGLDAPRS